MTLATEWLITLGALAVMLATIVWLDRQWHARVAVTGDAVSVQEHVELVSEVKDLRKQQSENAGKIQAMQATIDYLLDLGQRQAQQVTQQAAEILRLRQTIADLRRRAHLPMPAERLVALENLLSEFYPEPRDARRVADQAGLDLSHITFDAKAINTWHSIMREAELTGRLRSLFDVVRQDYADNPRLEGLLDGWQPA